MASELQPKRWTRIEYERLVERGVFDAGEPIELMDGVLVVGEPQSAYHFTAIALVQRALARAFGDGWTVRAQGPIALDDRSEPEPDVAVVPGDLRDYVAAHPSDPVLVVEVAQARLGFDRGPKSSLYARAGRPEYWIVNLIDHVLEVRRDPTPAPDAPYGWDYRSVRVLRAGEVVSPLARAGIGIPVSDLLP
jgi:Uma2 family endonuclease